MREALSDDFDIETLLHTDELLSYRMPGLGPDVVRRLREGRWSIQRQIDLHERVEKQSTQQKPAAQKTSAPPAKQKRTSTRRPKRRSRES
jgi:hypothetical protein